MSLIDSTIIIVYLTGIVLVGICYRGRQDNIRDYFTAQHGFGGVIGTVLVGLSLGATLFSALSFVAFPSVVYTYGVTALTAIAGVGRLPQVSMPLATAAAAPIGLSLIGAPGEDLFLLDVARSIDQP